MSERGRRPEEPSLFDLPLEPPSESAEERPEEPSRVTARGGSRELPLFDEAEPHSAAVRARAVQVPEADEPLPPEIADRAVPQGPLPASLGQRWASGLLDVLLHGALAGLLVSGAWLLGAVVGRDDLIALGLFLFVFSFLYTVYPLAFWGQTPGMIRMGIVAQSDRHGALTFGQTALRWLGGLLTLATLGIGSLLALFGGRSLTDRLSGTRTWRLPR